MASIHTEWGVNVLRMKSNGKGADLIDDMKIVELKFCIIPNKPKKYPLAWTVHDYQMNYNENQFFAFWGLGTYKLDRAVSEIKTRDKEKLEDFVLERELWIVDWDWMNKYPTSTRSGETELSEWTHTYRYPKHKDLPNIFKTYKVKKGKVHLTKGVPKEVFNL